MTIRFLLTLLRLIHFHQSINNSISFDKEIEKSITKLEQMGQRQFEEFFEEQLVLAKKLIDDFIKSNNMKLPGKSNFQKSKPRKVLTPVTVCKLKSSFQCKQKEVLELFQQELFGTAQSIAEDEFSLYHGTNSDILKRLDNIPEPSISGTSNNAILFDLSALIRVKAYSNYLNLLCSYINISVNLVKVTIVKLSQIGILKRV